MNSGTTISTDGTRIAWSSQGAGPPLVIVHCVATSRESSPQPTLPDALAEHFTVYTYDRRGTGQSDSTEPYAVEREFEDLTAIIDLTNGPIDVYGFSSGATLALLAAAAGVPIQRLVLLEPPLNPEPDPGGEMREEAQRRINNDVNDARNWFMRTVVGIPEEVLAQFPPPTEQELQNTRTIVHELSFLPGTNPERFKTLAVPMLLLASDHTARELIDAARQIADAVPDSQHRELPGEWHGVDDATLTVAIVEFLDSQMENPSLVK